MLIILIVIDWEIIDTTITYVLSVIDEYNVNKIKLF